MTWRGSQEMLLDDSPEGPRLNSKDTKRWCKGVVGREHDWQVVDYWELTQGRPFMPRGTRIAWLMDYCTTCGRHGTMHESLVL